MIIIINTTLWIKIVLLNYNFLFQEIHRHFSTFLCRSADYGSCIHKKLADGNIICRGQKTNGGRFELYLWFFAAVNGTVHC